MKRRKLGIIFLAVVYFICMNSYFGWNLTPQNDAEMVCDGINVLILALILV